MLMATTRPFAYNLSSPISGTSQYGNIAVGVENEDYADNYGGVRWWSGPDEDSEYIIASENASGDQPTSNPSEFAYIGFYGSGAKTDQDFLNISNSIPARQGQTPFNSTAEAYNWLFANGYWTSYPTPPTPTPTSSVTPTPTPTMTQTPTPSSTNTPTPSITASQTQTPTPSITASQTQTPTPSITASQTQTPTPTRTNTPTPSVTPSQTVTPTITRTGTPTPTPTPPSKLTVHFDISNSSSYPGSGSVITDLSGNGNTGTLSGDYSYSALNSGTISMGGTNSYVNVPQSASINISNTSTPVSVVMWINITAGYSNGDGIWNKNFDAGSYDGYRLIALSNNSVKVGINGSSYDYNISSANNAISTGTWMMLTTIVQGGTSYVYRDNNSTPIVQGATTAQSIPSNTANLQLCVGEFNTLGNYLPCRWGQFRYYKDKSLTTAEISTLFNADKAKYGL